MTDDDGDRMKFHDEKFMTVEEYRAGHAERMKIAQAKVDENLRKHAEDLSRDAAREKLVARIEAYGCEVHDGNCCEHECIRLPGLTSEGGPIEIDLDIEDLNPQLLALEIAARVLEAARAAYESWAK